jgi:hypothetical protein
MQTREEFKAVGPSGRNRTWKILLSFRYRSSIITCISSETGCHRWLVYLSHREVHKMYRQSKFIDNLVGLYIVSEENACISFSGGL